MKILIINLASETERMAFQTAQMKRLALAFQRIEAVTPDTLTTPLDAPEWTRLERPMKDVEKALLSSHRLAWQMVVSDNAPCLILEDDAYLSPQVSAFLQSVRNLRGVDHITLETRGRKKLVAHTAHPSAPMRRMYQDRTGAAAYILWPDAARNLLAKPAAIADALLCAAYDLTAFQADPALAVQLDQCEAQGLVQPIKVRSAPLMASEIERSDYSWFQRMEFLSRRLAAQLRMFQRQRCHAKGSDRRMIDLADDLGPKVGHG